ncbi:MAG TPA: YetF domain-containing protein [Candidatus Eisenbacteria bacterium]
MPHGLAGQLLSIALRTGIVYLALLVGLRLTGKRQVGQMTPFDLLLLLLLANAVQNAMTGPDTSVAGGLAAAATLFAANAAVAWTARRSGRAERWVEGTPTLLIRHGRILEANLAREGITREELLRALREHGVDAVEAVRSAILEVDGTVSVLREDEYPKTQRPHHRIHGIRRSP